MYLVFNDGPEVVDNCSEDLLDNYTGFKKLEGVFDIS